MLAIYVYQLNIWLIFEKHVAEFHVYFFKRSLFLESLYLHLKKGLYLEKKPILMNKFHPGEANT